MPVIDLQEAKDVDRAIGRVFETPDLGGRHGSCGISSLRASTSRT